MYWGFARTRWGLLVRLAGDSASATKALGYSVDRDPDRRDHAGGAIAGLGGASLTLFYPGSWNEGISSGQGLIAVALVIFARWSPLRCVGAALLFGGAGAIGPALQSIGVEPGLLPLQRRALRADAGHPRHQLPAGQRRARQPGRAVVGEIGIGTSMSGLGGLNKSPNGVVVGLVQLQLPMVDTPAQLKAQAARIVEMVGKARRNNAGLDLVVFPEYALHGLSMSIAPELMCTLDGPEVASFKAACIEHKVWGCFSLMEFNPNGNPYNTGIVIDDQGAVALYYRKLHPWVPVEAWEPGNVGIPVFDGPNGSKLALIICHDGMFPEMAREAAYKGAESCCARPATPRRSPRLEDHQPGQRVPEPDVTASVCLCGSDGSFDSMGEAHVLQLRRHRDGRGRPPARRDHHLRGRPDLVREARQLGRREQPVPALAPRLHRRSRAARWTARTPSCTTWWPAASRCLGRSRSPTAAAAASRRRCGPTRARDPTAGAAACAGTHFRSS